MKRGTDIPLLQSEVVRITLSADVVTSPRYKREPSHSLADFGSFSRFRLQEKHNASLFQDVLQSGINHNAWQRYEFYLNKLNFCSPKRCFLQILIKIVCKLFQITEKVRNKWKYTAEPTLVC